MKYSRKDFITGLECILADNTMRSVTVFCGDLGNVKKRIRMTRHGENKLVLTMGEPNWSERNFLKLCKKAKTKPRKVLFKFFSKKRSS